MDFNWAACTGLSSTINTFSISIPLAWNGFPEGTRSENGSGCSYTRIYTSVLRWSRVSLMDRMEGIISQKAGNSKKYLLKIRTCRVLTELHENGGNLRTSSAALRIQQAVSIAVDQTYRIGPFECRQSKRTDVSGIRVLI